MKDEALKLALEALEWEEAQTAYPSRMMIEAITAIKQALAAPVQSCYCPNCEAMGKELAALKAQPAPVQPVANREQIYKDAFEQGVHEGNFKAMHECRLNYFKLRDNTTPPAAKPAVPDALFRHAPEHPQYIEGWNDCRAEMLKGMK